MYRHAASRQICSQPLRASSASIPSTTRTCTLRAVCSRLSVSPTISQSRTFAAPRAPKVVQPPTDVYDLTNITPSTLEAAMRMTDGMFDTRSPAQYHEAAVKFANAIKKGASPWAVRFPGAEAVPANVLHEVGCLMRIILPRTQSSVSFAIAMWASASEMGYRSATISLAGELVRTGAWGRKSHLRSVESSFKKLVSEGKDSNALTVEGELLYHQERYDAAVKMLERALRLNNTDFEWKHLCQLCLGRSYLKLGKADEARGPLEASGYTDADAELGQMLRTTEPERAEVHMYMSALTGLRLDMFRQLAELEFEKEANAANKEAKKDHYLWAMEWSRLANPKEQF
ncbi:hypothetical protein FZEAL_7410 [Fusarium zealandicum]|uniref:Uncharacterized protein n=1 Tax=Fusarium zealandicum TaxID=1053134 RepID=A0A8H4XIN5_9HYPO|nr:hypothetical protein FZEAL_7410 [Fusarium zealandicum]